MCRLAVCPHLLLQVDDMTDVVVPADAAPLLAQAVEAATATAPDGSAAPGTSEGDFEYYDNLTKGSALHIRSAGPGRGKGGFATRAIKAEETLFSEEPFASMQHLENERDVLACHHCMRFVGTLQDQLALLADVDVDSLPKELPLLGDPDMAVIAPVVRCPGRAGGCAAVFCSARCRDTALLAYHGKMCLGAALGLLNAAMAKAASGGDADDGGASGKVDDAAGATEAEGKAGGGAAAGGVEDDDDDDEDLADTVTPQSVLMDQARLTNEAFLMAGRVVAMIIQRWDKSHDIADAAAPFLRFHAKPWWEVVLARGDDDSDSESDDDEGAGAGPGAGAGEGKEGGDGSTEEEFVRSAEKEERLREVVSDALALLKMILFKPDIHAGTGVEALFTEDFLGRVMGAFELNDIAVDVSGHLLSYLMTVESAPESVRSGAMATLAPLMSAIATATKEKAKHDDEEHGDESDESGDDDDDEDVELADAKADDAGAATAAAGADDSKTAESGGAGDGTWPSNWRELIPSCKGTALFPVLASLNHSCEPNCLVMYVRGFRAPALIAARDIANGEELTLSYIDEDAPYDERQHELR